MVSKKDEEESNKEGSEAAGWKKERWYGTSYKVSSKKRTDKRQAYRTRMDMRYVQKITHPQTISTQYHAM